MNFNLNTQIGKNDLQQYSKKIQDFEGIIEVEYCRKFDFSIKKDKAAYFAMVEGSQSKQGLLTVKKWSNRTLSQNAYLHLVLGYFACYYGYDMHHTKVEIFKKIVNPDYLTKERTTSDGELFTAILSTKSLDKATFALCTDRFLNYSAKGGLRLPEPSDLAYLDEIKAAVKDYAQYL
jgi:hypothetical protein